MDKEAPGMPVDQAAEELGVPADALRLYVAAHKLSQPPSETIPAEQVTKLKDELRSRAGALRLDDLAKTALTIEWLAAAAVGAAEAASVFAHLVSGLEKKLGEGKAEDFDAKLKPHVARIDALEGQSKEAKSGAVQMVGSLQGMVESQGRELDQIRSEVSNLLNAINALESKHHGVIAGLRAALDSEPDSAGKAKAGAGAPRSAPSAKVTAEEPAKGESKPPTMPEVPATAPPAPVQEPEAAFVNTPVKTPVKYRVKREIEYNFLLERMGYRRLDSYTTEETTKGTLQVPDDYEICEFLCKFELGCDPDEVEMVSVQRGEYQMVQYQRIEKGSGLKNWIGRGRA